VARACGSIDPRHCQPAATRSISKPRVSPTPASTSNLTQLLQAPSFALLICAVTGLKSLTKPLAISPCSYLDAVLYQAAELLGIGEGILIRRARRTSTPNSTINATSLAALSPVTALFHLHHPLSTSSAVLPRGRQGGHCFLWDSGNPTDGSIWRIQPRSRKLVAVDLHKLYPRSDSA
jgi:hypothetical protein